jgi:hypothetical protein
MVGEPPPKRKLGEGQIIMLVVGLLLCALFIAWAFGLRFIPSSAETLTTVNFAGCELRVVSLYDRYGQNLHSPWQIKHRFFNRGSESCVIQSKYLDASGPLTIRPGAILEREMITDRAPNLVDVEASVGATNTTMQKTHIQLYAEE